MYRNGCLVTLALIWVPGCFSESSLGSGREVDEAVNQREGRTADSPSEPMAVADASVEPSTDDDIVGDDSRPAGRDAGGAAPDLAPPPVEPEPVSAGSADPVSGRAGASSEASGAGGGAEGAMTGPVAAGTGGASPDVPEDAPAAPDAGSTATSPGPYEPREGSFTMLVYSKTLGFRHESIASGQAMLSEIADEHGFDVVFTETNEEFTIDGLSQYEIVFFLNTTGDVLNDTEQESYEEWMTEHDGAFAGVHSAADTESGWAFYSEVVGQYYDGHDACCPEANIEWDPAALDHVTVRGLPSPWTRSEEWFHFDRTAEWSSKPGFQILGRVSLNGGTQPVSYLREWGNFRAFYTSLGQEGSTFIDTDVKQHVAAGILWAVRREHLLGG